MSGAEANAIGEGASMDVDEAVLNESSLAFHIVLSHSSPNATYLM